MSVAIETATFEVGDAVVAQPRNWFSGRPEELRGVVSRVSVRYEDPDDYQVELEDGTTVWRSGCELRLDDAESDPSTWPAWTDRVAYARTPLADLPDDSGVLIATPARLAAI